MLVSAHMPNFNVYNYIYSSDGQDDVADYSHICFCMEKIVKNQVLN